MNVENMNQYIIDRGLHRLELGDTIWSATDAITGELGADFTLILQRLDCSLMALASVTLDARDAARAARNAARAARNAARDTRPR